MHLYMADCFRCDIVFPVELSDEFHLTTHVRGRYPIGLAILIETRSDDDTIDGIVVRLSIFQALENYSSDPFARYKPIGTIVKSFALTIWGQHSSRTHIKIPLRRQVERNASYQGHIYLMIDQG